MTVEDTTLRSRAQKRSNKNDAFARERSLSGWRVKTLGECCRIMAGFGFPERLQGKTSGDIPFFKVGDISEAWKRGNTYLTRANHYVSHAQAREIRAAPLPKGTTVFAKIGAAIALNRRAILSEPALVDNNVMGLYPASEALDNKFLFHYVCTLRLNELSRATTVPSVRKSDIEQIELRLPPLDEQQRIVSEIEKQFTRLDAGVASLNGVQAALKRYRASVLKAACEGRLVPTEAEFAREENRSYETGEQLLERILKERRAKWSAKGKYKEPAAPQPPSDVDLPEGWVWTGFEQLADGSKNAIKAGPFGSSLKKSFYMRSGFKIYGQEQVINGDPYFGDYFISHELFEQLQSCEVKPGDILISLVGTAGKVLILPDDCAPGIINPRLLKLSLNRSNVNPKFIKILLESATTRAFFKLAAHGGTMEILNLGILKSLPIPLPPVLEQHRIVSEVEQRLSVIEELEAMTSIELQRAARLRQSILQQAFGNVGYSVQNRNAEAES